MPVDTAQVTTSTNGRKRGKLRLLSRDRLDRRCLPTKEFDAITNGIAADLGGEERLSTVQRGLIEVYAGVSVRANDLIARQMLGQEINGTELNQYASTMVRVASRLGVHRVARDIGPTFADLWIADDREQQRIKAEQRAAAVAAAATIDEASS